MKSKIESIKVFAAFVILVMLLSAFNLVEKEEKSFLDTHMGTTWKYAEISDGLTIYAQINRSEADPFEIYLSDVTTNCFYYEKFEESSSMEFLENKKNSVRIKIQEGSNEHGIFSLTVDGDSMKINLDSYKNDQLVKNETFQLQKSTDNIKELIVCEN